MLPAFWLAAAAATARRILISASCASGTTTGVGRISQAVLKVRAAFANIQSGTNSLPIFAWPKMLSCVALAAPLGSRRNASIVRRAQRFIWSFRHTRRQSAIAATEASLNPTASTGIITLNGNLPRRGKTHRAARFLILLPRRRFEETFEGVQRVALNSCNENACTA